MEDEQIMEYYKAIGNDRGTLIFRYFLSNDPKVKAKALEEVREALGSLVCYPLSSFRHIQAAICANQIKAVEPLIFEPGTKWAYGQVCKRRGTIVLFKIVSSEVFWFRNVLNAFSQSTDWAGQIVSIGQPLPDL
jgi:hypothetical protein